MSWGVRFDAERLTLRTRRVPDADAQRQERTVTAILSRLDRQPGLVLADEVGMGKTFVALGVAACAAWSKPDADPVVVMVPPSLKHKWPRDFGVFMSECVRGEGATLRAAFAGSGVEFLKLLDDPAERRKHVIFLPHGALHRSLQDPWSKLAILEVALRAPELASQRAAFPRFAADVLRTVRTQPDPAMYRELLATPARAWRDILVRHGVEHDDDPVPAALLSALEDGAGDLTRLRDHLRHVPLRGSKYLQERLLALRRAVADAFQSTWHHALRRLRFRSPLLVLDEAHHARNPATRLASLFADEDAVRDADQLEGALAGCFERMLFLTATPFQLGHRELLHVLSRFAAVRWEPGNPTMTRETFTAELDALGTALDAYHVASQHLRDAWSRVPRERLPSASDVDAWWSALEVTPDEGGERAQQALRAAHRARAAMQQAEERLKPWIIRHLRSRVLDGGDVQRRDVGLGESVVPGREGSASGLGVAAEAVLPFMLAARTESLLARERRKRGLSTQGAATFGEGLASSYEAFRETRRGLDARGESRSLLDEVAAADGPRELSATARWYVEQMAAALPDDAAMGRHPKVRGTVERVVDAWKRGEKVLIFCHWRATGEALRKHVSHALGTYLRVEAQYALGCALEEVEARLENVRRRFDDDRPIGRRLTELTDELLAPHARLSVAHRERIGAMIRRFVREPSFLVRYYELESPEDVAAFDKAFREREDESGLSLHARLEEFIRFIVEERTEEERDECVGALATISVGKRQDREDASVLLPNVRLANGSVDADDRRNLLLAFNAPFLPEVLIASSVLAEGVDLHLDCRTIIHHDLSWNPSTLEQRTGRVDRLGCKAERVGRPIRVFLPFVAATQDEKMFRVVREREDWFNVLMASETGEGDARALPLPPSLTEALTMRLGVG